MPAQNLPGTMRLPTPKSTGFTVYVAFHSEWLAVVHHSAFGRATGE